MPMSAVLHLDLKPSNILINGQHQPHLIDFGAAAGDSMDTALVFSRFATMDAPEQRDPTQTPDARVDVFSVGLVCAASLAQRDADSVRNHGVNA